MKQLCWSLVAHFPILVMALFIVLHESNSCKVSIAEAQEWKDFIVSNKKLRRDLTEVAKRDLSKICQEPRLEDPQLTLSFNVGSMDFYILDSNGFDTLSGTNKPSTSTPVLAGTAPTNPEIYPVFLAYKRSVLALKQSDAAVVTDFDNVVLNYRGGFNGASGVFSAPVSGLYFIVYCQVKPRGLITVQIGLQKPAAINELIQMTQMETQHNLDAWGSVSVQMILKLNEGDQVAPVQRTFNYDIPQIILEWEAFLDKSRIFAAFLIPNTTYWTGISPPYPYINIFPAFSANSLDDFNTDKKKDVNLYYKNVYESEPGVMDAKAGVFTAKIRGIYFFSFSAIKSLQSNERIHKNLVEILKNKQIVVASTFCDGTGAGRITYLPNFAQVTLVLEAGDTINAVLRYGGLQEGFAYPTIALTGFLVVPVPAEPNALANSYPVFNAHRSTLVGLNKTKVIFDLVTINQGGHLNGLTGVFVAPVKGHYYFSYRDTTLKTSRYTGAKLVKNGDAVAAAHIHSGDGQTWMVTTLTTAIVLLLSPGDQVYVEQTTIGTGDANTTEGRSNVTVAFTGFLLNSIK